MFNKKKQLGQLVCRLFSQSDFNLSEGLNLGGVPPYKSDERARRKNFHNTPKRYRNLVLWTCSKFISTPKRYQFNNNKVYIWHCKLI